MVVDELKNERVLVQSIADHLNISNENWTEKYDIIKKELLLFGPVTITFPATEEFLHYSEGTQLFSNEYKSTVGQACT